LFHDFTVMGKSVMKRRSFLGFLGGAAAAGPKLAQGIASSVNMGVPMPPMGGYSEPSNAVGASASNSWVPARIAKLKAILAGNNPEAAQNRRRDRLYHAESAERFRLDSLRSIAPAHKMQMLIDGNLDRQERIQRLHAESELAELLAMKLF
jgi:hypothetical protein